MIKVKQIRFFSVALIVLFLATSIITRVVASIEAADIHSSRLLDASPDSPCSSDQQFPFEEKEKEFEDKSETDDRNHSITDNFFFICEVSNQSPGVSDFSGLSFFNSPGYRTATMPVPLYLGSHSLLI